MMGDIRITIRLNEDNPLHERVFAFMKSLSPADSDRQSRVMSSHALMALIQYVDVKEGRARHVVASLVLDESPLAQSAVRLSKFIESQPICQAGNAPDMEHEGFTQSPVIVSSSVPDEGKPFTARGDTPEHPVSVSTPEAILPAHQTVAPPPITPMEPPSSHPLLGRQQSDETPLDEF